MDFNFTREQELLKRTVHDFANREISPRAVELDEKGEVPQALIKRVAELGLLGTIVSREYGGSALGHVARMASIEEISRVCASLGFLLQIHQASIFLLEKSGTKEQKGKYLAPLIAGERASCMAITEPTGGSDPGSTQTTARLEGGNYHVKGRKVFISGGAIADICTFLARTDKGLSMFLVEKDAPGYKIGRQEKSTGLKSVPLTELVFSGCRIPRENLIGEEGKGLAYALEGIQVIGRTGAAGVALGIARGAYEAALKFAKERVLYGKPLAALQAVQFKLADIDIKTEAARWLVYYAAWLLDQGKSAREAANEISRAKAFATETANEVALKAMEIHGAYGTFSEYHVARHLRDSLQLIAAEGTNDIMRVVIGSSITK